MTPDDAIGRLSRALAVGGGTSSDFDLNPDIALPADRPLRAAGVLVAVDVSGREARVILTKRAARLRHHPGQIAFAGGKQDEGDASPVEAALREAEEEIGLRASQVEVLGTLPDHDTVTGFRVTPVVALVRGPFDERPEAGEVDEIFRAPFAALCDSSRFRVEARRWQGRRRHYYAIPYGPYYIWGATARILRGLSDRIDRCG